MSPTSSPTTSSSSSARTMPPQRRRLLSPQQALLLRLAWQERGVLLDVAGLARLPSPHPSSPPAAGASVLVIPGYLMTDRATVLLRRYLSRLGHDAHGWGLGANSGDLHRLLPLASAVLLRLHAAGGRPLVLVGWSLGGVIARELARQHPAVVRQVITLGTPLQGLQGTAFAPLSSAQVIAASVAVARAREAAPIAVPLTVVYTRRDNVVAWQSSLDSHNPHAHHAEVRCSHSGLVASADTFSLLAETLAAG